MAPAVAQPSRLHRATILAIGLIVAWTRWSLLTGSASPSSTFVGSPASPHTTRSQVALSATETREAYVPILRRDPWFNKGLQKYVDQKLRLVKRQEAGGAGSSTDAKRAYLRRLGLHQKADEIRDKDQLRPWHIEHLKPGDAFLGNLEHPEVDGGAPVDLTLKVTKMTGVQQMEGILASERGDFERAVTIRQDYPIEYEPGEQKDRDMVAYVFHKFNRIWRKFDVPAPNEEDTMHISLPGLQRFFFEVTEIDDFPSGEEFDAECADPSKGMTREEFLKYLKTEGDDYLDKSFKAFYTGRRILIYDQELTLDGDFSIKADNLIIGFTTINGKSEEGLWSLELQEKR